MFEMTQIDKRVQKKLFDRISQLNYSSGKLRDNSNVNIPVSEGSEIQLQEFMKSCWVRVTSAVPDKIETGKASAELLKLTNTFDGKTYNFNNKIMKNKKINYIRINIFPDGGISRIRAFGKAE